MENIILSIISSGVLSALIGAIVAGIQSKNMMRNALVQILYYQIKANCEIAIQRGYIDTDDLRATHEAWETYHGKLGGNGYLNTLMEKIDHLEIRNERG